MMRAMIAGWPRLQLASVAVLLGALVCGCTYRPAKFDVAAARQPGDLAATEVAGSVRVHAGVTLHEVRFSSISWEGGSAHPIRIQAFIAIPPGSYPGHS